MKLNTQEVAELRPDYLGFIFWEKSARFFNGKIPKLPLGTNKIGVFVDAPIGEVLVKIKEHDLQGVQLHGKESPEFCSELKEKCQAERDMLRLPKQSRSPLVIKVFSIKDNFDFKQLEPYEDVCDFYLFDTKGKLPGGNGFVFDWKVLANYPSTKLYFLSGGIGLEEAESIKEFMQRPESKYCHAIDVNSRFEIEPGLKDVGRLKEFKEKLRL